MGAEMARRKFQPEHVICSNAKRARQTLDAVAQHLDLDGRVTYTDELYATDAPGYLDIASAVTHADSIMLVGHNPMLEDLAIGLAETGNDIAISELQMGFRTAGLAIVEFDGPPADFATSKGALIDYITPADL